MVTARNSECPVNCVNLGKMIENYAWRKFTTSLGKAKSFLLKRNNYAIDFQWNFVDFCHSTHTTKLKPEDELLTSMDFGTPKKQLRRSDRWKKLTSSHCFYKKASMDLDEPVVMDTVYVKNRTARAQIHTFSCLSVTTPLSVEFSQNYSLGEGTTNIELALSSPTAAAKSFSVTQCHKQDFHDISVLNFDEDIEVDAGHRLEATLLAREKTESYEFEVTTTLSLAIGCLPVVIRRKNDDKSLFTCFITSLDDVFDEHVGANLSIVKSTNSVYNVSVKSRGKYKMTKWVDPQIVVQIEPIVPKGL